MRKKNYDNKKHAKEVKVAGDIMGAWQVRGRCFNWVFEHLFKATYSEFYAYIYVDTHFLYST